MVVRAVLLVVGASAVWLLATAPNPASGSDRDDVVRIQVMGLAFVPAARTDLEDRVVLMAREQDSGELWLIEQQYDDESLVVSSAGPVGRGVAAGLETSTHHVEGGALPPHADTVRCSGPGAETGGCEVQVADGVWLFQAPRSAIQTGLTLTFLDAQGAPVFTHEVRR